MSGSNDNRSDTVRRAPRGADRPEEFFWLYDPEGECFVYVGAGYTRIWQRSRNPLYEDVEPYFEAIEAEDRRRVRESFGGGDRARYDEIYRVRRPDGSTVRVRDRSFPLQAGSHSFPFEAGVVTEMNQPGRSASDPMQTPEERAGANANGSPRPTMRIDRGEGRYHRLFVESQPARLLVDVDGYIVEANQRAAELAARPRSRLAGEPIATLWRQSDRNRVARRLERVKGGSRERFTLPIRSADGSETPVEVSAELLELESNYVLDLSMRESSPLEGAATELESTREQLVRAQKMEIVGQLAGGLAHDFNNLLSIILSCTTFIERELGADSPLRRDTGQIRKASESAAALVRRLLGFARREMGQRELVDPGQLLEGLRPLIARALPSQVTLEIETADDPGWIRLVPVEFEQIVMNLAINARDAMPDGGTLSIEVANVDAARAPRQPSGQDNDLVRVRVRDTGQGMDEATRAQIFEPFFSTKARDRGTGLGLPTVLNLVERNDGFICVDSEPQAGSTFDVYFPGAQSEADKGPQRTTIPTLATGDEVVLVVDDDPDVRKLVERILDGGGYTVLTASGADEALEVVRRREGDIDLLLTDVLMPGTAGPVLAEQIEREGFEMAVLFTSGFIDDPDMRRELVDADAGFLAKPLTPDSLLNAVREALTGE
ncbi:MAG: response regulator [Persicimonas sp.]